MGIEDTTVESGTVTTSFKTGPSLSQLWKTYQAEDMTNPLDSRELKKIRSMYFIGHHVQFELTGATAKSTGGDTTGRH